MLRSGRCFAHPCRYALFAAVIAFGLGNGPAFADPIFNPSAPSGTAGGTITIEVDDTLPDALTGVTLDVSDSLNELTLTSAVTGSLLSGGSLLFNSTQSFPNLSVSFLCTPDCASSTGTGALFTLTFDVSATAAAGDTTILSIVTDPSAAGLYFPEFGITEYQVDASVPVQITGGTPLSIPEPPMDALFLLGAAMVLGLRL